MKNKDNKADFTYHIQEKIATISKKLNGETLELNKIQYGNYNAKFDLRRWSGDIMYKGVTLSDDELKALKDSLNQYLNN
jgi:hypothetical protein